MTQLEAWPPPQWTQVVVNWTTMVANADYNPNEITEWCRCYPGHGRWHLHGYRSTEGFAFRFEDASDAMMFTLRWGIQ